VPQTTLAAAAVALITDSVSANPIASIQNRAWPNMTSSPNLEANSPLCTPDGVHSGTA